MIKRIITSCTVIKQNMVRLFERMLDDIDEDVSNDLNGYYSMDYNKINNCICYTYDMDEYQTILPHLFSLEWLSSTKSMSSTIKSSIPIESGVINRLERISDIEIEYEYENDGLYTLCVTHPFHLNSIVLMVMSEITKYEIVLN